MATPHAFFALPLLLLGAASIQRVNTANSCAWAVDSCERSAEDSPCKVRLRRWCPCQKRPSWKCECKERKKCGDESLMVNVTEARKLTKTALMYASKLETFCDLKNCSTFPRKCVNFQYYDRLYEDFFLEKCCYDLHKKKFLSSFCWQITKYKWCFLKLCGYLPKPKPKPKLKPTSPPQTWSTWTENDQEGLDELEAAAKDRIEGIDFEFHRYWWVIVVLGVAMPFFISVCFCSSKATDEQRNSTTVGAKPPESRQSRATAVNEPLMHPQPGEPVPLNRLPANLKAKLPDPPDSPPRPSAPPLVDINKPE